MIITELVDGGSTECRGVSDGCMEMVKVDCELEGPFVVPDGGGEIVKGRAKAKRALVGAGARILFYPTLMYNVIRNKLQAEFRWWDEVDQFILLGAVPFPGDVPRLRQLGVRGVITLNEPYETLVPSSLYQLHGIDHLVIPTRDYLFAPSLVDICQAVDFIHSNNNGNKAVPFLSCCGHADNNLFRTCDMLSLLAKKLCVTCQLHRIGNASHGRTTYVHCKAGRGRSTTIVLCYLVEYKHMTPTAALEYVRSIRPRVLLAPSQWQAVQEYSRRKLEFPAIQSPRPTYLLTGDEVLISVADLEGYSTDGAAPDVNICLCEIAENKPVIVKNMPTTIDEDEVLVTEADLEGYNNFVKAKGKADSENVTKPLTRKLSCLFASLKFSSGGQSSSSRLHEIRAC